MTFHLRAGTRQSACPDLPRLPNRLGRGALRIPGQLSLGKVCGDWPACKVADRLLLALQLQVSIYLDESVDLLADQPLDDGLLPGVDVLSADPLAPLTCAAEARSI